LASETAAAADIIDCGQFYISWAEPQGMLKGVMDTAASKNRCRENTSHTKPHLLV
jgi:hypothetical protein